MKITGVEWVVAGVEDLEAARRFLLDYGLERIETDGGGERFSAMDGSGVELRSPTDPLLPPATVKGSTVRLAVWGVADEGALKNIEAELSKDRQLHRRSGLLITTDDDGNGIGFRVSQRHGFEVPPPLINVAGLAPGRPINQRADFDRKVKARSLGHIVYWSPDPERSTKFYTERLGFRVMDRFPGKTGSFLRAQSHREHHSVFLFGNTSVPPGFQHLEFDFGDVHEVLLGGKQLVQKGWKTSLGPGRHKIGSNWYWYFSSPLGGDLELSADVDYADDRWVPRDWNSIADADGWSLTYVPAGGEDIEDRLRSSHS